MLIQAVRWIPALMLAVIGSIGWAVFGAAPVGWLLAVALLVGIGAISLRALGCS